MSAEAVADPPGPPSPQQTPGADSFNSEVAAWTRAFFSRSDRVVAVFWAGGFIAAISVLPFGHWTRRSFLALVAIAVVCSVAASARLAAGRRLPRWALHVDVGLATVLASALAAIGATNHVPFADLYVWVALFAVLYFRPPAAVAHIAGAGAGYAVVLAFGPGVANPWAAWLAVFGTVAVAAAVVFGLVSVLRVAAREDPLTGLANRRSWDERLGDELERSRRTGIALSVAMFDLDGFKAINDTSGHDNGDRLLQQLAHAWQAAVRGGGDFLARIGGDEFGLLAPGSDETGIRRLAKRLADALPDEVTVSVGVATWDRTENASDLLRRADGAMYQTKQRRRSGEVPRPA